MAFIQGNVAEKDVYLSLNGNPSLGVLPNTVICQFRVEGQDFLTTKVLDSTSWIELGSGFYLIRFTSDETNTVGIFFYTLSGVGFDNFLYDEFTIEPTSPNNPIVPPGFCQVSGSVLTVGNAIPVNAAITFRAAEFPLSVNNSIVTSDKVVVHPNPDGSFVVNLVQGAIVIVEIERSGIFAQISIPIASTANLINLLPPFPNT